MNRCIKRYPFIILLALMALAVGCKDDITPEVTDLQASRLFSPAYLQAQIINQTSVRLTWKAVNKAESYTLEFFDNGNQDFSGEPVKTVTDIHFDDVPYIVPGFDGETDYSVRIKAIGKEIADSKWSTATFKTDAEQIFETVDPDEITDTQAALYWPAGESATTIVLTPGNVTHTVTAEEIAAGKAVVTGLTSETDYTAKLMRGTKTRGTIAFTTLIDLSTATVVSPGDDLSAIVQAAQTGDVIAILPGTYTTTDITITKSIAIKGANPAYKPTLNGTILRLKEGAGLELSNLVLDGTISQDGNQAIIYDADLTAGTYGSLIVKNCAISNYTKGLIYVNKICLIESVIFTGNMVSAIECNGGDFIDFRKGIAKTFVYTNNTVYDCALARDFFRMDAGGSTNFPDVKSLITITNNTFNNVSNTIGKRLLYIRLANHEITFNKNIIATTECIYTNQSATTIMAMSKNNYFNAPNVQENDPFGDFTSLDPGFKNADQGDFAVSNLDLKLAGIGDPRWLK